MKSKSRRLAERVIPPPPLPAEPPVPEGFVSLGWSRSTAGFADPLISWKELAEEYLDAGIDPATARGSLLNENDEDMNPYPASHYEWFDMEYVSLNRKMWSNIENYAIRYLRMLSPTELLLK